MQLYLRTVLHTSLLAAMIIDYILHEGLQGHQTRQTSLPNLMQVMANFKTVILVKDLPATMIIISTVS